MPPLAGMFELASTPRSFVVWRLLRGRRILELRRMFVSSCADQTDNELVTSVCLNWEYMQFDTYPSHRDSCHLLQQAGINLSAVATIEGAEAPVQLALPHPALPSPFLFQTEELSLHVMLVTTEATFYQLVFPAPYFFHESKRPRLYASGYQLTVTPGRRAVMAQSVDYDTVAVAWNDGTLTTLKCPAPYEDEADAGMELDDEGGGFSQEDMTNASIFSTTPFKNLKDRMFGTPMRSASEDDSGQQAVSMTSLALGAKLFVFTLTRDRRLRIWNLVAKTCVKSVSVIGKPRKREGVPMTPGGTNLPLLSSIPRRYLHVFDEYAIKTSEGYKVFFKVAVYISPVDGVERPSFVVYSGALSESGQVTEWSQLSHKPCPAPGSSSGVGSDEILVDFAVAKGAAHAADAEMPMAEDDEDEDETDEEQGTQWVLWTLWDRDRSRETIIRYTGLVLPNEEGVSPSGVGALGDRWMTVVSRGREILDIPNLEHKLKSRSVQEVFLDHIFAPGRFSMRTIKLALDSYEDSKQMEGISPPVRDPSSTWDRLRRRAAKVVGSSWRRDVPWGESNAEDQAAFLSQYNIALRQEWAELFRNCMKLHEDASAPCYLYHSRRSGTVSVVKRAGISVVREADSSEVVGCIGAGTLDPTAFLTLPEALVAPNHPAIADRSLRTRLNLLWRAIELIRDTFGTDAIGAFEDDVVAQLPNPMSSLVHLAVETQENFFNAAENPRFADRFVDMLRGINGVKEVYGTLLELVRNGGGSPAAGSGAQGTNASGFSNALVAAATGQIAAARHALARDLLMLIVCATGVVGDENIRPDNSFIAECFVTYHGCRLLAWLCERRVSASGPDGREGGDVTNRMSTLRLGPSDAAAGRDELGADTLALHLLRQHYLLEFDFNQHPLQMLLRMAPAQFISKLGLTLKGVTAVLPTPEIVLLAQKLMVYRHWDAAEGVLVTVPHSAASRYLRACVEIERGEWRRAREHFESAAAGLRNLESQHSDLANVLPPHIYTGGAGAYFRHVMQMFHDKHIWDMVAVFARLALKRFTTEQNESNQEAVKTLYRHLFTASLEMLAFDEAYEAMIGNPDEPTRFDCLRHFVTVAAEHGRIDLICSNYPFVGMQHEVERTLQFKARADAVHVPGKPGPNYYTVLYGYHVFKGDYRSAAMAMYQYARRLNGLTLGGNLVSVQQILSEQARSYLAAINALDLVDQEYRWIVAEEDKTVAGWDSERGKKRRRIDESQDIDTAGESATPAPIVTIRETADLRKEYLLALSKLELINRFSETSGDGLLDPRSAVSLSAQAGMYDYALSLGATFGMDLGQVFERFTEKCVMFTRADADGLPITDRDSLVKNDPPASWEGSESDRAWRLLQKWLDLHDTKATGYAYHRVVMEKMLSLNRDAGVPVWLISFYRKHHPEDLIRTYLKYGLVKDAAQFAVEYIERVTRQ
ncbi:hypothetical protein HK104_006963 [Borealophlyctis nickersoniae]|nr:hypothetical protein HK104_006963 [Borealophlyctis nickersoniae]